MNKQQAIGIVESKMEALEASLRAKPGYVAQRELDEMRALRWALLRGEVSVEEAKSQLGLVSESDAGASDASASKRNDLREVMYSVLFQSYKKDWAEVLIGFQAAFSRAGLDADAWCSAAKEAVKAAEWRMAYNQARMLAGQGIGSCEDSLARA